MDILSMSKDCRDEIFKLLVIGVITIAGQLWEERFQSPLYSYDLMIASITMTKKVFPDKSTPPIEAHSTFYLLRQQSR